MLIQFQLVQKCIQISPRINSSSVHTYIFVCFIRNHSNNPTTTLKSKATFTRTVPCTVFVRGTFDVFRRILMLYVNSIIGMYSIRFKSVKNCTSKPGLSVQVDVLKYGVSRWAVDQLPVHETGRGDIWT